MTVPSSIVGLLTFASDPEPYEDTLRAAGAESLSVEADSTLPNDVRGLCVAGNGVMVAPSDTIPAVLRYAIDAPLPVLAIGTGMQLLNIAFGGGFHAGDVTPYEPEAEDNGPPHRRRLFLAPGGKIADAIGGAGFVMVSTNQMLSIDNVLQAPGLIATAHSVEDGMIMALERPGFYWQVGVRWRQHMLKEQPSGFERLTQTFVRHACLGNT